MDERSQTPGALDPSGESGRDSVHLDPSEQEGTRGLQAVAPLIERRDRRRLWFFRATLGGLGLGLILLGVGLTIARLAGNAAVAWEHENIEVDPQTGVRLGAEARTLPAEGASSAVLMVHGWSSSPNDFGEIPTLLFEAGLHVRQMRLPGHGMRPEDFRAATLEDWRAAVREEFAELSARFDVVHVVGFSMGGALSIELASEVPIGRLVVIAPFFGLPYPRPLGIRVGTLGGWFEPLLPWIDAGGEVLSLACRDHVDQVLKYRAIPLRATVEVDRIGDAVSDIELLERVTAPLLVVAAPDDPVASAELAFEFLRATSSPYRREVVTPDSSHILAWDCDCELVAAEVVDFLTAEELGSE
ncbi:MAG: alpha/beta hydrolase [Planctomycetota bacterium]|jgi:carboxylesterase